MNINEHTAIKEMLSQFSKTVTETQINIVYIIIKKPRTSSWIIANDVAKKVHRSTDNVLKTIKRLRALNVLTEDNELLIPFTWKIDTTYYPMPDFIRSRILPPVGYQYTHLAAYLATNTQLIDKVKSKITIDDTLRKRMYELQESLAICAIISGDLQCFTDMQGTIQLSIETKIELDKLT